MYLSSESVRGESKEWVDSRILAAMHGYVNLLDGVTNLLSAWAEAERGALERLQTEARTLDVKTLQRVNLLKAITAIGMFSLAEAMLQDSETGQDGFKIAAQCLDRLGDAELKQRFADYRDAINVLKHGRGTSYDRLVKRGENLPFKIKRPDEAFFHEGDVSEGATLVKVDDEFVRGAAEVVRDVLTCVTNNKTGERQ